MKDIKNHSKCADCPHLRGGCNKFQVFSLSIEQICEICRIRKEMLGLTNDQVARKANVGSVSVDRIMSMNIADIRFSTLQRVIVALFGADWLDEICMLDALESEALKRCQEATTELEFSNEALRHARASIDHLKEQVRFSEEQLKTKDYMLKRRGNVMMALCVGLVLTLAIIIVALLIDAYSTSLGFFWR